MYSFFYFLLRHLQSSSPSFPKNSSHFSISEKFIDKLLPENPSCIYYSSSWIWTLFFPTFIPYLGSRLCSKSSSAFSIISSVISSYKISSSSSSYFEKMFYSFIRCSKTLGSITFDIC